MLNINPTKSATRTDCMSVQESLSARHFLDAKFVEVYRNGEFLVVTSKALASFMQFDGDFQFRAIDQHVDADFDGFVEIGRCSHCGEIRAIYDAYFCDAEVTITGCMGCHDTNTNEMIQEEFERQEQNAYEFAIDKAHAAAQGMER